MSMAARGSLASFICPSTPFLLPRLARAAVCPSSLRIPTTAPNGLYRSHVHCRFKSSAKFKKFKQPKKLGQWKETASQRITTQEAEENEAIGAFMQVCRAGSIDQMAAMYAAVVGSLPLQREHTRQIASAVHYKLRSEPVATRRSDSFWPFVERLVQDIRSGTLPPHPTAHVHLLGIYKRTGKYNDGCAFWQWLVQQDESYADAAVYGAAIELLAYQGATSLPDLEELYAQALKRFPGTFAEYHLSPEAIVADKALPTTITGLPMTLLQGITTARIFSRDWKRSYLAIDTALRLYPASTPSRFFELFMYERPLIEAYTVFAMACRSGIALNPDHLTNLLRTLEKSMETKFQLAERMAILRAMAHSVYAYLETGRPLHGPHVGAFVAGFSRLLPKLAPSVDYAGNEAAIRDSIAASASETIGTLVSAGMTRVPQAYTSLVSIAIAIKSPTLLEQAVNDIGPRVDDIGDIGRRHTLLAAGQLGQSSLMENYWSHIVTKAETQGMQLPYADWITLARACKGANRPAFLHKQLEQLSHTVTESTKRAVIEALEEGTFNPKSIPFVSMSPEEFDAQMSKIKEQIQNIATIIMSRQPLDLRKTPLSMHIDPTRLPLASTADLRAVYDELTTDPHQPPPVKNKDAKLRPVALSATRIPLEELRFQNWVAVVELMNEADAAEQEFQKRLDEAIAKGTKMKDATVVMKFRKPDQLRRDMASAEEVMDVIYTDKSQLRQRVMELRTPSIAAGAPQSVRYTTPTQAPKYPDAATRQPNDSTGDLSIGSVQFESPSSRSASDLPTMRHAPSQDINEDATKSAFTDPSERPLNLLSKRKQYKTPQATTETS
ncbi:hypothetical protein BDV96DRAFT_587038 [Lophiotrema nucula]|uniref:Uncharacterized protein n=1 Tax=Lophiotrema nucula TaxID=690887 RepID=A0A6A5YNH4_9PLEO|nr:hypothetical protein BDV96DRAFT_587038 [Lophiotrema nucula]